MRTGRDREAVTYVSGMDGGDLVPQAELEPRSRRSGRSCILLTLRAFGSECRCHPAEIALSASVYFADANPSAQENSRSSSFGGDTFR